MSRETGIDTILAFLRTRGKSPAESLVILCSDLGIGLVEAQTAIYESEAWRDAREAMNAEIEQLTDSLPRENDRPVGENSVESKG